MGRMVPAETAGMGSGHRRRCRPGAYRNDRLATAAPAGIDLGVAGGAGGRSQHDAVPLTPLRPLWHGISVSALSGAGTGERKDSHSPAPIAGIEPPGAA